MSTTYWPIQSHERLVEFSHCAAEPVAERRGRASMLALHGIPTSSIHYDPSDASHQLTTSTYCMALDIDPIKLRRAMYAGFIESVQGTRAALIFDNGDSSALFSEIADLESLQDDWDGYGAPRPSETALALAKRLAAIMSSQGLRPRKVLPSAPGGIFFRFGSDVHYAHLEVFNDGEMVAALDDESGNPRVWNVEEDLEQHIRDIRDALG